LKRKTKGRQPGKGYTKTGVKKRMTTNFHKKWRQSRKHQWDDGDCKKIGSKVQSKLWLKKTKERSKKENQTHAKIGGGT